METVVLIDTCALIDFLGGKDKNQAVETLLLQARAAISVVTVYELFRGVDVLKSQEQRDELVNLCKVLELTKPVARKAAEIFTHLRSKGTIIPHEDILIGATALHWKHPIYTANKKDFQRIPHLEFFEG